VRYQIVQDRLVGVYGTGLNHPYLYAIRKIVHRALSLGLNVVINASTEAAVGYGANETLPNYTTDVFWLQMMRFYKNNPHVIFDLFNEPRRCTWNQWYVAFQKLVNFVREHGAHNTLWVEGKDWASTLKGMPLLHGYGIWYSYHHLAYPWAGPSHIHQGPENWQVWYDNFGYLAAKGIPVVDGEVTFYRGGYNLPMSKVLLYLKFLSTYHIGMLAWSLLPGVLNGPTGYSSVMHEPQSAGNLIRKWFETQAQRRLTAARAQARLELRSGVVVSAS
jgi:hypothetical protein